MRHGFTPLLASAFVLVCAFALMPASAVAQQVAPMLSSAGEHSLALHPSGTVKAWGRNNEGQLGLGNTTNQTTPQFIPSLSGVAGLAAGSYHSLALLTNGTVKAWGYNGSGELGLGNTTNQNTPQLIPGLSGVAALTANNHSLALLTNGTVKAWGVNGSGELGLGNTTNQNTPQLIPGLSGVAALAAGGGHTLALLTNGTVKAWGWNTSGQLGLGNTDNQSTPQLIPGLSGVAALAAGFAHTLVLLTNGTVKAWGLNSVGHLGLGTTTNQSTPQLIPGLSGVVALAAGEAHSIALLTNGTVKAWGWNGYGQLGLGNYSSFNTPQLIPGLNAVSALTSSDYHPFALQLNGTVKAWGYNNFGQLGLGNTTNQSAPQIIPGLVLSGLVATVVPTTPLGTNRAWSLQCYPASPLGTLYIFDISLSGSSPGIVLTGVGTIPLNPPLLNLDLGAAVAPFLSNFIGALDAGGLAAPTAVVPFVPALMGVVLSGAAITLDPTIPSQIGLITPLSADTQIVAPVAAVNSVLPGTAPHFGGTLINIVGSGFMPGAAVSMGGVAATNVAVLTQWTITCNAPAHTPGTGSVSVTNPGTAAGTWSGQFVWLTPLAISTVTPLVAAPGTTITVNGTEFETGTTLYAGGQLTSATVVSTTQLTFAMPSGLACSTSVVVGNPNLQTATFTGFNPSPSITGIPIASGPATGGGSVMVLGANFHPGTTVTIGGQAVSLASISLTSILGIAPAGSLGTAPLVVTSASGCTATGTWTWY